MIQDTKPIKIIYGNEVRTTDIPSNQFCCGFLKDFITKNFSFGQQILKLVYKDDGNDYITISTDEELHSSLTYSIDKNPLVLYLIPENHNNENLSTGGRGKKNFNKNRRIPKRILNPNLYSSLGINDTQEVEFYKAKVIELHNLGFKRTKYNLRMLVSMRQGNDFSACFEEIKKVEEERFNKRKLKKEKRDGKMIKKKKERIYKNNKSDDEVAMKVEKCGNESNSESGNNSEDVVEQYDVITTTSFDIWPELKYCYLFIDGNNLLYLTRNLRKNSIGRKKSKSEEIIVAAVETFACVVSGISDVNVMFDTTKTKVEKTIDNGTKFCITSARPKFRTTDDAFIEFTKTQTEEQRSKSLHVTSDVGLTRELCKLGASVMKPKLFFSLVIKKLNGDNIVDIDFEQWFEDVESKLKSIMIEDSSKDMPNESYNTVYQTKGILKLIGRNGPLGHKALTVSLNDSNLPTQKRNPHLTVLFYNEGFSDSVFDVVNEERNKYMQNKEHLTFNLSKWGGRSDLIHGELYDFCMYMRQKFSQYSSNERPPHVEMR